MSGDSQVHIGFDVGTHSVGMAAILKDEEGWPLEIPYLLTVKHDSGKDEMSSGQTNQMSRKKSGGMARRSLNRKKHRNAQRSALRDRLVTLGFPVRSEQSRSTYEAWENRIRLRSGFIPDATERAESLATALQHMERHRGWVNSWLSFESILATESPTDDLNEAIKRQRERGEVSDATLDAIEFQCDLAALGLKKTRRIRPRNPQKPGRDAVTTHHLLGRQRREDVVREWLHAASVQQLDDDIAMELAHLAFSQERPRVPAELIGKDWIPGYRNQPRASTSSLEFQEFRIRQAVANLGVRSSPRSKERRRLTIDEQTFIVDTLMSVTKRENQPTWRELAEGLDIEPQLLVHMDIDDQLTASAPINASLVAMQALPKRHPLLIWWQHADAEHRAALIARVADPELRFPNSVRDNVDKALIELTSDELEVFDSKVKFPSGRAKHCRDVLIALNMEMSVTGDDYTTCRNRIFNNGAPMVPERETLDSPPDHPTLQRILPPARRFLRAVEHQYGTIGSVTIEHVRDAFMGFDARSEYRRSTGANRKARERAAEHFKLATGETEARKGQIRKLHALERQNGACLYCGRTLSFRTAELDHIVPRASGGSNRQANLAAVCRSCNERKGKLTFSIFAANSDGDISLAGAIERVRTLNRQDTSQRDHVRLQREMIQRLRQTSEDQPVDERSLASTAFAATDLRERIQSSFGDDVAVPVYRGTIVSIARKASQIEQFLDKWPDLGRKSRMDRRHHAIDAAVSAMLNTSVATTLAERDSMREAYFTAGQFPEWASHEGSTPAAQAKFRLWKQQMGRLGALIAEKLEADDVVVMQPVRYSARLSKLHEDGRLPHMSRPLQTAWADEDMRRVVDRHVYSQLVALGDDRNEFDSRREITLASGLRLRATDPVFMYPDKAARIQLPKHSSSKLGGSIHHARFYEVIYKGKPRLEMLRIWGADLFELPDGTAGDLYTQPVHPMSAAVRRTSRTALRDALHAGEARQIGWLAIGDEIEIDPLDWTRGAGKFESLLRERPTAHWQVVGIEQDDIINLRSMVLAAEGVTEATSPVIAEFLKRGARISFNALFEKPGTRVVRRNALGVVRDATGPLPSSWSLRGE